MTVSFKNAMCCITVCLCLAVSKWKLCRSNLRGKKPVLANSTVTVCLSFLLCSRALEACLESTGWETSLSTSSPARDSIPYGLSWRTGMDSRLSPNMTGFTSGMKSITTGKGNRLHFSYFTSIGVTKLACLKPEYAAAPFHLFIFLCVVHLCWQTVFWDLLIYAVQHEVIPFFYEDFCVHPVIITRT